MAPGQGKTSPVLGFVADPVKAATRPTAPLCRHTSAALTGLPSNGAGVTMTLYEKEATINWVSDVVAEHSVHNWDGYGALPVSSKTHEACVSFVHSIADHPQPTDIIPDPDGEVSFAWRNASMLLSVSVGPGESMTWIFRDGIRPASGTDVGLALGLPSAISRRLMRFKSTTADRR